MPTLDDWFAARDLIRRVYQEELGRDVINDPDAITNWLYHVINNGRDEAWLRTVFHESNEYKQRHGNVTPPKQEPVVGVPHMLKVTDARDGEIAPRMYSYWSSAWIRNDGAVHLFVSANGYPRFYRVENQSAIYRLGPLLPFGGEAEGWYWDREGWVYHCQGAQLLRSNPFTQETVVVLDISGSHAGCDLWQPHSSDDGQTHSATVRRIVNEGSYPKIGTVVVHQGQEIYFDAHGVLDESAVTSDGTFVVIKEDDDNRIINLDTRDTRLLRDENGALGHSDCGPSYMVGEADRPEPQACVLIDLTKPLTAANRVELFRTSNMGHVSVRAGRCVLSDTRYLSLVALDGGGVTPLVEHGMIGSGYDQQVEANLDPSGRVACWLSNRDGRMDAYLLWL